MNVIVSRSSSNILIYIYAQKVLISIIYIKACATICANKTVSFLLLNLSNFRILLQLDIEILHGWDHDKATVIVY